MDKMGIVYLVGAGPGDPGLLTVRATQLISQADIILYDRLVSDAIMKTVDSSKSLICVGRAPGDETTHQDATNQIMLESAQKYSHVVRLKGGDPTMFGRGGEEAEFLRAHSVPFEIIPGITSGHASATYAGIPLTHRRYSSSVAFVTGHEDPDKDKPSVDWKSLAKSVDTIVIMMGLYRMRSIFDDLVSGGMNPDTPAVAIHRGTTAKSSIKFGTLSTLPAMASTMRPPVVIIVGEVVDLHEDLSWI